MLAPWSEEPIVAFNQRLPERPFYTHMSPAETSWAFENLDWDFQNYTRFTCVRDPYDRLVSIYRAICEVDGMWHLRRTAGLGLPKFARWVQSARPNGRGGGGRNHQRWRQYGTWSAQHWSAGQMDHIIRLEHLEEDLEPILAKIGISPAAIPQFDRRRQNPTGCWYNAGLSSVVAHRYAWDLSRFGYRPPELSQAA